MRATKIFSYSKNSKVTFISVKLKLRVTRRSLRVAIASIPLATLLVSLRAHSAVSLLRRAFSRPLLPHLPSPASVVHFHLTLPPPVRILSSRAMLAVIMSKFWLARLVSVRDNRGKKRKNRNRLTDCSRFSFLQNHICDLTRVEPVIQIHPSASPILEFSCAICDRFSAINRSVRHSELV